MRFRTVQAVSLEGDAVANARTAVRKIMTNLQGFQAAVVVFFASTDYDPETIASDMHDAFPDALTIGCSTAGEGINGEILNHSVVAMAMSAAVFSYNEFALVVGNKADVPPDRKDVFTTARDAMKYLGRNLSQPLLDLDFREYVGYLLTDRISAFSERVMDVVGEMTDVLFLGGVAGDDYKFTNDQRIFYQGRSYKTAALMCLWKPVEGFSVLKTQAVDLTNTSLTVTKADEENRIVYEFDSRPAAEAYAEIIGTPVESMDILDFDENPLALNVDGEPFLRALVKQTDNGGLQMFARVVVGMRMTVTRAGNVYEVTKAALDDKFRREGPFAAMLHTNCASRHTSLRNANQVEQFAKLFGVVPSVSFSSYGEIYVGILAMTSSIILFK
ncbi:MAG: FIST C-terminal domain-containing protein [Planctomycetes bacterium]|nr:FIST C-terminal domain-containing protein [Planctomycetota bacterium]